MTVRVYNYAEIPRETLKRGETWAARIFRQAGVETRWMDCPLSAAEAEQYPACQQPHSPRDLVLRVLPRSMAQQVPVSADTFGFALPGREGGFGAVSGVFYHRVEELSREVSTMGLVSGAWLSSRAMILGHLMVHELGHLLLGLGSHSAKGIMGFPWGRKELQQAALGALVFTPKQAQQIRAQMLDRMRAAPLDGRGEPKLKITVRIFKYAKVPGPTLAQAQREASRIFRAVGVETAWLDRTHCVTQDPKDPSCHDQRWGPTSVSLNVLPRSMSKRSNFGPTTFGVAMPARRGFGSVASVFFDRVEELADREGADRPMILAHVMAHEIGHLLLGLERHADRGLMRGGWSREDLISMSQGTLLFHPEEAQRIRAQMLKRIHALAGKRHPNSLH